MNYDIQGGSLPVLICNLNEGESMITERGGMAWATRNMRMETVGGGIGKMFGRYITGESVFQNVFTAEGGPGLIAFTSSFPGSIRVLDISPGNEFVVQKTAFMASTPGVELDVFFNQNVGGGFFGGEGFVMQKLSGSGTAFIEIDGHAVEYTLGAGQSMSVNTGYLAGMSATCSVSVEMVKGVKNMFLGGEGLFNMVVSGPGKVLLQSMPISEVANMVIGAAAGTRKGGASNANSVGGVIGSLFE